MKHSAIPIDARRCREGVRACALIAALFLAAGVRAGQVEGLCAGAGEDVRIVTTELAGVPAVLRIPPRTQKSPVVLWHGLGPPASEQALMEALPLDDVPAVKVYLGLPLFGKRAPAGGTDELARRQQQDVGLKIFAPIVVGATDELPRVAGALRQQGCMRRGEALGLLGFSAGGAAVLLSLAEHKVAVGVAVLVNPATGLRAEVDAFEHATGQVYRWSPASRALARRTDWRRRAEDIVKGVPPPAILVLEGAADPLITHESLRELDDALTPVYTGLGETGRFRHQVVQGLAHTITGSHREDELGKAVSGWLNQHLSSAGQRQGGST